MYTKKILSAAAAVAIMSTGAMSFEAFVTDQNRSLTANTLKAGRIMAGSGGEGNGTIMTELSDGASGTYFQPSSYVDSNISDSNITLSNTFKGDALIYPAFNQKEGWGTEIVVRNTTGNAIVAKAVLYSGVDSHEVKDFNIYLSAKDVCRFTIENGKITSTDGSIKTFGIFPHQVDRTELNQDLTDYREIKFANTEPLNEDVTDEYGYVAIFGMEQSVGRTSQIDQDGSNVKRFTTPDGFHNDHAGLYAAYAQTLDNKRPGWRSVVNEASGSIKNGLFIKDVFASPVVLADTNNTTWVQQFVDYTGQTKFRDINATFEPVADNSLTGQVRIYNTTAGRDMLLNATAINGFTDNHHKLLWTEGEYASIADRCINIRNESAAAVTNSTLKDSDQVAQYDLTCITKDAYEFMIDSAVYTYANAAGSIENKLLLTQPYKRLLAQLNNAEVNGTRYSGVHNGKYIYNATAATPLYQTLETGESYNFTMNISNTFDEDEQQVVAAIGGRIITSPITTGAEAVTFNKELQEVNAAQLEKHPGFGGEFDNKNGFTEVNNIPMPAITTQMVGSIAGPSAEMNWVYTDNVRQLD
jgi:hypothetical protein